MQKIIICPKCESKYIRRTKNRYICEICNKNFSNNTTKHRAIKDNEYLILNETTSKDTKDKVFDLFFNKNKFRILNRKNINMKKWLDIYYIKYKDGGDFISVNELVKYLKNIDGECEICGKELEFTGVHKRGYFNKYCKSCQNISISIRQTKNNTVYKINDKEKWKNKISKSLKKKIKNGDYKPNITNSWCNSMCITKIENKYIKFRSTWEAFFNKVNYHLEYEKVIIPYEYKGEEHNYIVDFVDTKNKILYEIKPKSEKFKSKNKVKFESAMRWCSDNNYTFNIIDDDWFISNFDKNYQLLDKVKDIKIIKNLKQFSNENKEY